jgi:hypothetical protein
MGQSTLKNRVGHGLALAPAVVIAVGFLKTSNFEAVTAPAQMADIILAVASGSTVAVLLLGLALPARLSSVEDQALGLGLALPARLSSVEDQGNWLARLRANIWPWEAFIALAVLTGLILSLSIALAAVSYIHRSGLTSRPLAWFVVSILGIGGALISAKRLGGKRPNWMSGTRIPWAAFLAPALLLSLLQFWVQTSYIPSRLEASITIQPSLNFEHSEGEVGNQGSAEFVLTNGEDTATTVLLSTFRLCFRNSHTGSNEVHVKDPACDLAFRPIGQSRVEAKGALTYREIFTWDDTSSVLQSQARIAYARADRLRLGSAITPPPQCTESLPATSSKHAQKIEEAYPILPASRYRALVSVPRILAYGPGDEGGYTYWITDANDPICSREDDILREFGIQEMRIYSREWIPVADNASN